MWSTKCFKCDRIRRKVSKIIYSGGSSLDHDENSLTTADLARGESSKLVLEHEIHRDVLKSFGERSASKTNPIT